MLAVVHLHSSAVEKLHCSSKMCGIGACHVLTRHCEHSVAREDSHIVVPAHVHGGFSAAHVGFVHHVVVEQGEVVVKFNAHSLIECTRMVATESVASHQCEHRAQALSAKSHGVGNRFVESRRRGGIFNVGNRLRSHIHIVLKL